MSELEIFAMGLPVWIANRADGVWVGSYRSFNLPQPPANLYRRHFKMPGFGLPKILVLTIYNIKWNITENRKFASYQIVGNVPRTTIVLRFDANLQIMADTSVSSIHPLRQKSTSRIRQDRERLEQHKTSIERIVKQNFGSYQCLLSFRSNTCKEKNESSDLWR